MPSYKLEMGKPHRKRSRVEVITNASITKAKMFLPIRYERDDADFDSDTAEGLWGFVGETKTATIDLLTDEGVALVQFLRTVPVATKIHIPPMGERIFIYVSPEVVTDMEFKQQLLSSMQRVADNPSTVFEGANGNNIAQRLAERAGRRVGSAIGS